jgi:RNA polymerase sigma-70 factor (ECF subfamily)
MAAEAQLLATALQLGDNLSMSPANERREERPSSGAAEDTLETLIRRSQAGEAQAMEAIYDRFKSGVFNLAFRYAYSRQQAEDILQDVFVRVFTRIGDVRNVETFPGWIFRIALNSCYSYLRAKRREMQTTVPLVDHLGTLPEPGPDPAANDIRKPLEEAIAGLSRSLKAVFLLHDVQGFKHEEIARILGISVGTSKSHLFKARMKLRSSLSRRGVFKEIRT